MSGGRGEFEYDDVLDRHVSSSSFSSKDQDGYWTVRLRLYTAWMCCFECSGVEGFRSFDEGEVRIAGSI